MARPPDRKEPPTPSAAEPPTVSRTRQIPQMLVEPSGGVGPSSLAPGGDDAIAPTQPTLARPRVVVMEEHPIGLADALAKLGYLVRAASTGVEAMSMCAEQAPVAVVVGPGDAERRRVLTAALRLRFGTVLIVYAMPVGDVVGRHDGVSAILPWPLPSALEVTRAIPFTMGAPTSTITRLVPPTAGLRARSVSDAPELSADHSAEGSLSSFARPSLPPPTTSLPPVVTQTRPRPGTGGASDGPSTLQVARAQLAADTREAALPERTTSGPAPEEAGEAAATAASADQTGDVWREAAPLIWRLDEAARFLDELGRRLPGAADHADTVRAAVRLMTRMQERPADLDRDG